jgi:hypothetical protein
MQTPIIKEIIFYGSLLHMIIRQNSVTLQQTRIDQYFMNVACLINDPYLRFIMLLTKVPFG